jgi:Raf kinase inhibitor-like YbhB/YbcL family protein
MEDLEVKSPSFENNAYIPRKHTGFDVDISPEFRLFNLHKETVSICIMMNDLNIPLINEYNHWLIWNIPKIEVIPENIPYGPTVPSLHNAIQGVGYGVNRYRGPKQPFFIRNAHRYVFHFYALDCFLDLKCSAKKKDLLEAMQGHILQQGSIMGKYKRQ